MNWELVNQGSKGLLLGWKIPGTKEFKEELREALPDWSIVTTVESPFTVTSDQLLQARKLAKASAELPVSLMGWSAGCQSVRAALLANLIDPWGVAVFDGTHASVPPQEWQINVWRRRVELARAGYGPFVATATQMTYTKDIPAGQPGRAWPTRWVLSKAFGAPDNKIEDAETEEENLFFKVYPSDLGPTERSHNAHIHQIREHAIPLLKRYFGPGPEPRKSVVKPPCVYADSLWRDPKKKLAERLVLWAHENQINPYPNESYEGIHYKRYAKTYDAGAVFISYGIESCRLPKDRSPELRRTAIEFLQDAESSGTFHTDKKYIKRGDLVLFYFYKERDTMCIGIHAEIDEQGNTLIYNDLNEGPLFIETNEYEHLKILGYIRI